MNTLFSATAPAVRSLAHRARAAVLIGLMVCCRAWAEDAPAPYQPYPLRYKAASDVEKILAEMLSGIGGSTHVVADPKANQVLLRGPEKAQQLARQLIDSIDRPPEPSVPRVAPAPVKPVLRTYPCPEGQQSQALARLRKAHGEGGEVRMAADPPSGQLLILAPPAVHDEIAREFPAQSRSGAPPARSVRGSDGIEHVETFIGLTSVSVQRVETTLREILGARLAPLSDRRATRPEYRFANAAGQRVELSFDRQRNGVQVSGPGTLARQFVRLVRGLDAGESAAGRTVQLVPLRHADPAKVRQAVDAYRSGSPEGAPLRSRPSGPRTGDQGSRRPTTGIELVSYLFQPAPEAGKSVV